MAIVSGRLKFGDLPPLGEPPEHANRPQYCARGRNAPTARSRRLPPAASIPAISELAGPFQAWLATLRSIPADDPSAKELIRKILVLIGLHQALVYAIHDRHEPFNALDWHLWGEAPF